jgi:hypothetical protein
MKSFRVCVPLRRYSPIASQVLYLSGRLQYQEGESQSGLIELHVRGKSFPNTEI